jgi:hypothetical protein
MQGSKSDSLHDHTQCQAKQQLAEASSTKNCTCVEMQDKKLQEPNYAILFFNRTSKQNHDYETNNSMTRLTIA